MCLLTVLSAVSGKPHGAAAVWGGWWVLMDLDAVNTSASSPPTGKAVLLSIALIFIFTSGVNHSLMIPGPLLPKPPLNNSCGSQRPH